MTNIQREPGARRAPRPQSSYRILVASAGDASSLGAIRVAAELARVKKASVQVLMVAALVPRGTPSPLQVAPPLRTDEDNRLAALEAIRQQLASVQGTGEWELHSATGWPPERLLDAAERWHASLLLVGIGEHGRMDRLVGSETAVKIAQRAKVPMLAVPHDATELPTRAVAAIDFTESSIAAAELAATLLAPDGVLSLVHASLLVMANAEPGSLPDVYTRGALDKLETIRRRIQSATKRTVRAEAVHSEIVDGLLSFAEREHCDLLTLGGHDQRFFDRLLLGSVRTRVLRHARCQVLVAPHASPLD